MRGVPHDDGCLEASGFCHASAIFVRISPPSVYTDDDQSVMQRGSLSVILRGGEAGGSAVRTLAVFGSAAEVTDSDQRKAREAASSPRRRAADK